MINEYSILVKQFFYIGILIYFNTNGDDNLKVKLTAKSHTVRWLNCFRTTVLGALMIFGI